MCLCYIYRLNIKKNDLIISHLSVSSYLLQRWLIVTVDTNIFESELWCLNNFASMSFVNIFEECGRKGDWRKHVPLYYWAQYVWFRVSYICEFAGLWHLTNMARCIFKCYKYCICVSCLISVVCLLFRCRRCLAHHVTVSTLPDCAQ